MIKAIHETEHIIDFSWDLSNNSLSASYPRVESREELQKRLERAIGADHERIIAYYIDGVVRGVCVYLWDPEEKYAQATQFLIDPEHFDTIADHFIDHLGTRLSGYELLIGVPAMNRRAIDYFEQRDFDCIESSIDTRLHNLKPHQVTHEHVVEKVTEDNFDEYALFHDKYALPSEMYYHSKNLKRELDRFRILALRRDERICSSIFAKTFANSAEIFGLFSDGDHLDEKEALINQLLVELYNEFGALEEIIFFIDEEDSIALSLTLRASFEVNDSYRCFRCTL